MKKRVKALLTIRVSLTPGVCRWCRCTYDNPCANNCRWVDRTQTLCSECWPLDEALKTARRRQALVLFLQENWPAISATARQRIRPRPLTALTAKARPRR